MRIAKDKNGDVLTFKIETSLVDRHVAENLSKLDRDTILNACRAAGNNLSYIVHDPFLTLTYKNSIPVDRNCIECQDFFVMRDIFTSIEDVINRNVSLDDGWKETILFEKIGFILGNSKNDFPCISSASIAPIGYLEVFDFLTDLIEEMRKTDANQKNIFVHKWTCDYDALFCKQES